MASTPDSLINHEDARAYWSTVDPDVNGMLGGFPYISRVDLQGSKNFLAKLGIGGKERRESLRSQVSRVEPESPAKVRRAVDCGAGIGRIATGLLLSLAHTVDIVEPIAKFSDPLAGKPGIGRIWTVGLEEWDPSDTSTNHPTEIPSGSDGADISGDPCGSQGKQDETPREAQTYDLIWNQWCLGHLTDAQLISYLRKCAAALTPGGWIVVKENLGTSDRDVFDKVDSSVTRLDDTYREIFQQAGLRVRRTEVQKGLPKELYPVRMYALQPAATG